MKTVIALTLILVVAAQATFWRKIRPLQPYRESIRASDVYLKNGREAAPPGLFPFLVHISVNNGRKLFSGSLIKEDKVLTSAQCCSGGRIFHILVGANNHVDDEPSHQLVRSTKCTIHESYNPFSLENDICIIHLDFPVKGKGIETIRLPSHSQVSECCFVGWAATVSGFRLAQKGADGMWAAPFYSNVSITENQTCRLAYPVDTSTIFCAKGLSGVCDEDAGNPLTITECDGVQTQIGIASFGPHPPPVDGSCGRTDYPDGYVRLSATLDWMQRVAGVPIRP
ncbi:Hypothetical predicted protein [Cloeon dipterum]|uniref:Peptidase S1 domain-containing protein n=1 Tax=Cloeon dipterum TaxID=197152 RepID=A0A8S1CUR9_9INSE|nr:Hypothetical predicted protein [Cloeon dipterum]